MPERKRRPATPDYAGRLRGIDHDIFTEGKLKDGDAGSNRGHDE